MRRGKYEWGRRGVVLAVVWMRASGPTNLYEEWLVEGGSWLSVFGRLVSFVVSGLLGKNVHSVIKRFAWLVVRSASTPAND
jgi:hypothetical protein